MGFNEKKFQKAKFTPLTREIELPELADFFDAGEKPVWIVRNLTGSELRKTQDAADLVSIERKVVDAIAKGDTAQAIKHLLGADDDVDPKTAKDIEAVLLASVSPEVDRQTVVKLFTHRGLQAIHIANTIYSISGTGSTLGK